MCGVSICVQGGTGVSDRPEDSKTPESLASVAGQDIDFFLIKTEIVVLEV